MDPTTEDITGEESPKIKQFSSLNYVNSIQHLDNNVINTQSETKINPYSSPPSPSLTFLNDEIKEENYFTKNAYLNQSKKLLKDESALKGESKTFSKSYLEKQISKMKGDNQTFSLSYLKTSPSKKPIYVKEAIHDAIKNNLDLKLKQLIDSSP